MRPAYVEVRTTKGGHSYKVYHYSVRGKLLRLFMREVPEYEALDRSFGYAWFRPAWFRSERAETVTFLIPLNWPAGFIRLAYQKIRMGHSSFFTISDYDDSWGKGYSEGYKDGYRSGGKEK